eukprot:72291_1
MSTIPQEYLQYEREMWDSMSGERLLKSVNDCISFINTCPIDATKDFHKAIILEEYEAILVTFGYIRCLEKIARNTMPSSTQSIVLSFYYLIDDYFYIVGKDSYTAMNEKSVIKTVENTLNTTFGKRCVTVLGNNIHKWDIKIDRLTDMDYAIGISSDSKGETREANFHYEDLMYFQYYWTHGRQEDIIGVELNTKTQQVSFYQNDELKLVQELMFENNTQYRLAVSLCGQGDRLTILTFKIT